MRLFAIICYANIHAARTDSLEGAMLYNGYRGTSQLMLTRVGTTDQSEFDSAAAQMVLFVGKSATDLGDAAETLKHVQAHLDKNHVGYVAQIKTINFD